MQFLKQLFSRSKTTTKPQPPYDRVAQISLSSSKTLLGNSSRTILNNYVEQVKTMTPYLGAGQHPDLHPLGEEIGAQFGASGLEYVTQQIRQINGSVPGRELEAAWEDIWYRYR